MNRVYYYADELNDDFAGTHITAKKLPPDYKYVPQGRGWKAARFFVYKLFATPIIMLAGAVSVRYKNKRVLRGCKKGGAFIYGNHTAYFTDALNPTNIAFPRTADVVVNADAVSIRGIGGLVRLLGAVPVPQELCGLKNFSSDIVHAAEGGHWVAIYPEAHIWPYYTGIRPFGAASFKYPAKCGLPVFAYTTVYKKRRLLKRPKKVVYIDGPFFAEGGSVNERAHALRDKEQDRRQKDADPIARRDLRTEHERRQCRQKQHAQKEILEHSFEHARQHVDAARRGIQKIIEDVYLPQVVKRSVHSKVHQPRKARRGKPRQEQTNQNGRTLAILAHKSVDKEEHDEHGIKNKDRIFNPEYACCKHAEQNGLRTARTSCLTGTAQKSQEPVRQEGKASSKQTFRVKYSRPIRYERNKKAAAKTISSSQTPIKEVPPIR